MGQSAVAALLCTVPLGDFLRLPHFGTHPAHAPGFLPEPSRDHTLCPESLPDVGVVPLAVEFGVGQHQPDARPRARAQRVNLPRTTASALLGRGEI